MNQTATVTIKPHPREVVREFLEACKNHGSNNFYEEVVTELRAQINAPAKKETVTEILRKIDDAIEACNSAYAECETLT